jgi:hypothetical protein
VSGAKTRRRLIVRTKNEDDGHVPAYGMAWA